MICVIENMVGGFARAVRCGMLMFVGRRVQGTSLGPRLRSWPRLSRRWRTRIGWECVLIPVRSVSLSLWRHKADLATGHTFAAGYDLRTQETYEKTMEEFERIVGFKYLKGMHLNDSQGGGLGCHKDRHENIGLYVPFQPRMTLC